MLGISNTGGTPYLEFTLPSGNKLRIREQNGEDDDTLSLVRDNKDGSAMMKFIANITLEYNGSPGLTPDKVAEWGLRDKYYTIFKSRRFSLGDTVNFDYIFQDGKQYPFFEELDKYDWDFEKGVPPKKGEPGYSSMVPQAYPKDAKLVEFELASGKKVSYEYMTGKHEVKALGKSENELTLNDRLRFRNFKLKVDAGWQVIERFNMFTAREMHEIRTNLDMNDPDFNLMSEVTNPDNGAVEKVTLLQISDFFFPVG